MSHKWRNTSVKIILILFFICVLLGAFSVVNSTPHTGKSVAEDYGISVGQSVFNGDSIVGVNKTVEVPLLSNLGFINHLVSSLDLNDLLLTFTTGAIPFDFSTVSSEGITANGIAEGITGPGYLTFEGDKIAAKSPDHYVWGYSVPYKYLTRTEEGVDVIENGSVVRSVPESEIKNLEFSNDFYNATSIVNWYNYDSSVGSNFTLEKGISYFSDGRDNISASDVSVIFGKNVSDYVAAYPTGAPIVLYMGNTTEESSETYSSVLGSYPQYGNTVREYNARQFVEAWNGTIIPPNCTASGQDYVSFGAASDSHAPGGSAAHGVCPPARALRAAVLGEGFSLPVGMSMEDEAVLFGYNPARDIKVTNTHDYPIQILMWTSGSGTGMEIYAKIVRYLPMSNYL